jgi:class 3 adenylate cyclase
MIPFLAAAAIAGLAIVTAWTWRRRAVGARAHVHRLERELQGLQGTFSRFLPARVVDRIITARGDLPAERKQATILFADIAGFTAMSERTDPAEIVEILNGYFERMSRTIAAHEGHVAKFIGDGLMATFGAVSDDPWQIRDAVQAALGMREALAEYNSELSAKGTSGLRIGIGIHHGAAIAGLVGSEEVREFTVIGDVVNTAARVESLTRIHGKNILVTRPVMEKLGNRFILEVMPPTAVKGKTEPVETWFVVGPAGVSPPSQAANPHISPLK